MKKQHTLSEKIKRYSLVTSSALATAFAANAQVVYTDVNPDYTGYGSLYGDAFSVDLNNDGITDFTINARSTNSYDSDRYWDGSSIGIHSKSGNSVAVSSNLPQAMDSGADIGTNLDWDDANKQDLGHLFRWWGRPFPSSSSGSIYFGNFLDQSEKFLGVRFEFDGEQYYGWIRLSLNGAYAYTVHDFAYEATPNKSIVAGDTGTVVSCQVVTGLNTANIKSTSAKLGWDSVPDAYAYMVRYKTVGGQEWTTIFAPNNYKKISGLLPSTKYVWQAKELCEIHPSVKSDWSAKQEFTTTSLRVCAEFADESSFNIYPNPTTGAFTIDLSISDEEPSEAIIQIINLLGQIVQEEKVLITQGLLQKKFS